MFITVIFFIAGPLAYITIATVVISLLISWYLQRPLKTIIENSNEFTDVLDFNYRFKDINSEFLNFLGSSK